jgi:magnesium chelatase family protein
MLARVNSGAVNGIDAVPVEVEVDITHGFPHVAIVGLPDAGVKESLERVRAALNNSGYAAKMAHLTVNLAPADLKKEGPSYDLPIALGILAGTEQLVSDRFDQYAVVGELALDGRVRSVKGCLPMAIRCKKEKYRGFVVSEANAAEAAVVDGLEIIPVKTLVEAVGFFSGRLPIRPYDLNLAEVFAQAATSYELDFADVKGQEHVKRALTVAAAGDHNVIMIGPPGSGKTMLAQRIPSILPLLSLEESLETTKIYSVAGLMRDGQALIATRPFRAPHHTVSDAGLVGGGTFPRPGEVSLSHHGVLFLDELPEFDRHTLEVLRQPLEEGYVTISRAKAAISYPTQIMLICALNPCPCGYHTDPRRECHCTPNQIQRYLGRISGPLLDRIDIHVDVPAVQYKDLASQESGETSAQIREKVVAARERQRRRFAGTSIITNSRKTTKLIKKHCALDDDAEDLLRTAMTELALSARAHNKILKVSRTIADLADSADIQLEHVAEAIQYRTLDRALWR